MIASIIKWVGGDLFRAPFVVALCLLASHWFYFDPKLHDQIDAAEVAEAKAVAALNAEKSAHAQTSVNHKLAVAEAERLDRANIQRVKAEAAAESQEIVDDLEARLNDARRRADAAEQRLRSQADAAPARASGGAAARMPAVPNAATGAGETAGDHRLPAPRVNGGINGDEMSINERLIATEQALQLDALIQWVTAMGLIDVNGAPAAPEEPRHGTE